MAVFNRFRPGYELVKVNFEWNIQIPFLRTTGGPVKLIISPPFSSLPFSSPLNTPENQWKSKILDRESNIAICAGKTTENFSEPFLVKISILNKRKKKVLRQILSSKHNRKFVTFVLTKDVVNKSDCQQTNGSYTFCCTILSHVKQEPISTADPTSIAINCSDGLSAHLEGLFNDMKFNDVIFNINDRRFPAHKNILVARSEVFAAMLEHPTKEKLTNRIIIDDIGPDVFHELLRFIYTGRVPLDKLETMAARLFITADKYLLDELKMGCENYLLHQMSPDNCFVLLLHGGLLNPAEQLKEAAKFFRRYPSQVMATDEWQWVKIENPALLCDIQEFVYRYK